MTRLFYWILTILLAPLFYAFFKEGLVYLSAVFTLEATKWFLLGGGLGLVAAALLIFATKGFINHFLHEFEHGIVSFFFTFKLPSRLEVDPEKGSKVFVQTRGGCIVALAPYYFPLLTVPFLIVKAALALILPLLQMSLPLSVSLALDALIGATFVFHLVCSLQEFRFYQDDIKKTGYIPSIVGVLFMNFVFFVLCIAVVTGTYAGLVAYGKAALAATIDAYKAAWQFLVTQALPAVENLVRDISALFCRECTPTPGP